MRIADLCVPDVVQIAPGASVREAAMTMRSQHVGSLVVTEVANGRPTPVGILTDRDIVLSIVATDAEHLPFLTVSDAMSDDILTAFEETSLSDALKLMQERGVRRLPVLDRAGALVGIVTADDVIRFLAEELGQVVKLMNHEEQVERRYRV